MLWEFIPGAGFLFLGEPADFFQIFMHFRPVGEKAANPAFAKVRGSDAFSFGFYNRRCLAFGSHKQRDLTFLAHFLQNRRRLLESSLGFSQVDDVNSVPFLVNKLSRFGMPAFGLVAKMAPGFK